VYFYPEDNADEGAEKFAEIFAARRNIKRKFMTMFQFCIPSDAIPFALKLIT